MTEPTGSETPDRDPNKFSHLEFTLVRITLLLMLVISLAKLVLTEIGPLVGAVLSRVGM